MTRQNTDDGRWFDLDSATAWQEENYFDGHNFISVPTGSQWEHESLWRTKRGLFVLCHWSQWQGTRESWRVMTDKRAAAWLRANSKHEVADRLFPAATAAAEV